MVQANVLKLKLLYRQWRSKRGREWGHAPWSAGLGGAPVHFLQSFKNTF